MDPNWDDFKVLLALARGGSVAGAARTLKVDHSTVSRRLAALEDAFGAQLLMRGGREFAWTTEGRSALEAAETVESAILAATRSVRTAKLDVVGAVRVSIAPAFVVAMMPMLAAARVKHPQLDIQLSGDYRRADLARGEADIAVRMARPDESGLVARRVFEGGWGLYASTSYVAANGLLGSFDELRNRRLVLYVERMHNVAPLRWMEDHRGATTQITRVDNIEIAAQVILSGGGVGLLPCFTADTYADLVRVVPEPVIANGGWIVYHEAARDTARVRAAVDILVEFFETNATFFAGRRDVALK